ncbi:TonB-dependent receptor [Novosphingobium sp.]|uniref:TonB-dependent receptor n=1 Tax=Novosphingobium sp. TaxID=1874826 RepID=UPI0025EB72DA|nr:TonB-dependent receptor [Novosphingobium sp.]MCC6925142.1 TonB-dependent receptor [Novosphingobium sp.]
MKLSAMLRYSAATLSLGLALSAAAPALAQEAAADDQGLGEIIVTAQRRAENQKDVPISVATLNGETLKAVSGAGADIRALSGRVPSLNIESSFGRTFPRFYIRGLGNTDFDLNASQPVSLVYDDVVLENPILKGFPVFDLDRVEVLRGPQGTLFGRNTPAGIVKFDSVKPDAKGKNYVRASYGSFGTVNAEAGIGGELSDAISARASVLYQQRNNWVDNIDIPGGNDLEGFDDFAARLQIQAKAGDALTLRLTGQIRSFDGNARLFRANAFATGSNKLIGLTGPASEFDRRKTRADGLNFQHLNNYNLGFTAEYDAGPVTITSVTSLWNGNLASRGDIDGGFGNQFNLPMGPGFIPFSAQSQDDVPSLDQITQELRIASNNKGGLGYQVGLFLFNEKLDITSYDFGSPTDTTPAAIATQRQDSDAVGVFGSVNYQFDNGLKLQAGLRYNHDKRAMVAERPVDTRPAFLNFGGPVSPQTANVSGDVVTWDVAATMPLNQDVNLFARIARGYRAPSIQGRLVFGRTLSVADKETTMSYEAGLKSTLGGVARFNLTGFYYSTDNMQLTAVGGASNFTTLINAKKVDGYGFEAEFEAKPVQGLTLTAGLSYNHNEIKDPNLYVAGCGAACTVTNTQRTGSPGIYSINGNQLPQSPRWIANWTAGYEMPVGDGHVYLFTDWAYRSKIQFFLYNSVEFSDDKMLEGGLRIGYRTDAFDVAVFGRNITDDVSAVSGIDFNNLTAMVNEPRIWGFEVGMKF